MRNFGDDALRVSDTTIPVGLPTAYVLMGVQASGKSTWAGANAGRLGAVVLASDAIRNELAAQGKEAEAEDGDAVFAIFNRRLAELLQEGRNVISDATHARRAWRRAEIDLGRSLAARLIGVWFDVPLEECLLRNTRRAGQAWGDRTVPEDYLRQVAAGFEEPQAGEFDEVWRIGG